MSMEETATETDAGTSTDARARSLTETIVTALADEQGCRPEALEPPLYEVIDPDALEALFAPRHDGTPRRGGRVVFEVGAFEVCVGPDRSVAVRSVD